MNATKPLAVLFAVLLVGAGAAAAAGSSYETGTESYAVDATMDDGTVTVTVERGGSGLANATVYANGDQVGTTDANGTVSFETSAEDELEITVEGDAFETKSEYAVQDGSLVLEKSEFEREDESEDEHAEQNEHADDREQNRNENAAQTEQRESERNERAMNADASSTASANSSAEARGPPTELPEQAADRASSVHGVINDFLSGDVSNLGHALSDLLGGGDAADGRRS
ncbi:MAG: hypothetical protein ABEJ78_08595 [Haloferacaceae archaeon]